MLAAVRAIEYYLPELVLTNTDLAAKFPEWMIEKVEEKTGITERHIAAEHECASDLGVEAAKKLFASGVCQPADIDYLLLCTQTPDYFLPTTACIVQERLGIPTTVGALDLSLGCSGFVYGLGLAKGLIETGQAHNILLITTDTYSKLIAPSDRSVRTIFGDAAAATLVQDVNGNNEQSEPWIGPFVYGTDGKGADNLIVRTGGMRAHCATDNLPVDTNEQRKHQVSERLYMNGAELFNFTLKVVPQAVDSLLSKVGQSPEDIDLFVFHQANQYILEHLRKKLKIPKEKFYIKIRHCGNTVSSTIPIALKHALEEDKLQPGYQVMLVGFGVGYSWGASLIRWVE